MRFLQSLLPVLCLLTAATTLPAAPNTASTAANATKEELVVLKLELPMPDIVSDVRSFSIENFSRVFESERPPLFIPQDANHNIARGKSVTSSSKVVRGELSYITEGDKDAAEDFEVELEPGLQWVQIDLQKRSEIFAIALWHFHRKRPTYKNVIIQISDDPKFEHGGTTVFNTDHKNTLKFGIGKDQHYMESHYGKLVAVPGVAGRYVRLYSQGNTDNRNNHYIEVEVYGRDARAPAATVPPVAAPNHPEWFNFASTRIEKHRKNDLQLTVTRNGKPVPGAHIEVAMLRHEFLFGCNIFKWESNSTPAQNIAYRRQFADIFNFATLGFYWWDYERAKDDTTAARTRNERIAGWCKSMGITAKGHPLAWNFADPHWIRDLAPAEIQQRQLKHVSDSVRNFAGKVGVWDVVNEAVEWNRTDCRNQAPRLTDNIKAHGSPAAYIKACFAAARKAIPAGTSAPLLLVNDYQTRQPYELLLKQLNGPDGRPIYDAIGIQSHMLDHVWSNDELWKTCERFAHFRKPLHFTELTIMSTERKFRWSTKTLDGPDTGIENGESAQRDNVVRVYTMLFSHPAVEAVTWWDLSDQGAWMSNPSGLLRADMTPKPAYLALKKLVCEDWATNATLTTDVNGKAGIRAFRGEYRFTVTLPDGTKFRREFYGVVKKGENEIQIVLN